MQQHLLQIRESESSRADCSPLPLRVATCLKVRADCAEVTWVKRRLALRPVSALALLALAATACGSSASPAASGGKPHLSPVAIGRDKVTQMVLADGDLPGYRLQSTGSETIKDQLPPPKLPHAALARRLVRANWIASEHSVLAATGARILVLSDANLFRSAAAAHRIWDIELHKVPGTLTRFLKVPAGAPAGAVFAYERQGVRAGFQFGWRQGPVIGFAIIVVSPKTTFSPLGERRIGEFLAKAARAQAQRIAAVESGAQTT
jgi:hypothetical protein